MKVSKRLAAAVIAALAIVAFTGSPAFAAAPTNDVFSGAEVVGGLPFAATLDTTEATTDADDDEMNAHLRRSCDGCERLVHLHPCHRRGLPRGRLGIGLQRLGCSWPPVRREASRSWRAVPAEPHGRGQPA